MKSRAMMLLAALTVLACTMIGHEKVDGWPALEIVEHYVPTAEMRERCAKYAGFGMSPEACAEFRFSAKRCDIWFSSEFPPSRWAVNHERLHCQGYDHIGMNTMARMLSRYRDREQASAGATQPSE